MSCHVMSGSLASALKNWAIEYIDFLFFLQIRNSKLFKDCGFKFGSRFWYTLMLLQKTENLSEYLCRFGFRYSKNIWIKQSAHWVVNQAAFSITFPDWLCRKIRQALQWSDWIKINTKILLTLLQKISHWTRCFRTLKTCWINSEIRWCIERSRTKHC